MITLNKDFPINTEGTDYFVGDIHGMYDLFWLRLNDIEFDPGFDRMFSVGDLIDRGPDSEKCLELLNKPWFHAVKGNHEQFLLGSHSDAIWAMNGGAWAFDDVSKLPKWRNLVKETMPLTMTVDTEYGKIGIVHSEPNPDWNNNSLLDEEKNLWSRTKIRSKNIIPIDNIDLVIVGHTVSKVGPIRYGNILNIDTGAVFGQDLTIIDAEDAFYNGNYVNWNKPNGM